MITKAMFYDLQRVTYSDMQMRNVDADVRRHGYGDATVYVNI